MIPPPETWVTRVMEARLKEGFLRENEEIQRVLVNLCVVKVPLGVQHHDFIFFYEEETETTTCQVCGHRIVGSGRALSIRDHLELHRWQVHYVLRGAYVAPIWEFTDEPAS